MLTKLRRYFPLLNRPTPPLYFDSACSALKPASVIKSITDYYEKYPACAGRSLHTLATEVNAKISDARQTVGNFIGARADEIIFTKNTTESINLVAHSLLWRPRDIILTIDKEHNSNLLPWLSLKDKKVKTVILPTENGQIKFSSLAIALKNYRPRLLALSLTSNLDGLTLPVKKIINEAKKYNCLVLLDAAQTLLHYPLNVKSLGADKVIDYTKEDFSADKERYDIIFDAVGKISYSKIKPLLKPKGQYFSVLLRLDMNKQVLES